MFGRLWIAWGCAIALLSRIGYCQEPARTSASSATVVDICGGTWEGASAHFAVTIFPGKLLLSRDRGNTWRTIFEEPGPGFIDVENHGSDRITLIGTDGRIWESRKNGGAFALSSVRLEGGKVDRVAWAGARAIAVGREGTCWITRDEGQSWKRVLLADDFDDDVRGVFLIGEAGAYVVGGNGVVFATGDDGQHWRKVLTPDPEPLFDISFSKESVGWAVGRGGSVFRSADGLTWKRMAGPNTGDTLQRVATDGAARVVTVGIQGAAYESLDDGETWRALNLPKKRDWSSLWIGEDHLVLVGGREAFIANLGNKWGD